MSSAPLSAELRKLMNVKYGIIGNSEPILDAVSKLIQAAPTELTVLITGETGTGKEVFANAVHGLSNRKKHSFISVNCGAIPETLLESELFGHERGAFTGAVEQRKGYFEVANNGTIFLDEIGEMPIGTQVKLLRVLESGEFTRLGSTVLRKVDVRVIAATNRKLEEEVSNGNFRQDLFFRLNNVQIVLPPLRNHIEDIQPLVDHFAKKTCEQLGLKYDGIDSDALAILKNLPWPGNVRELKNLIGTLVTLEQETYITSDILKRYIPKALPAKEGSSFFPDTSLVKMPSMDSTSQLGLEIIFRTLLEMKSEIGSIKTMIHTLANQMEAIKVDILSEQSGREYHDFDVKPSTDSLSLTEMEKELITLALSKYDGNRRIAAKELGISERTLYRKLTEYNIN